MRNDKHLAEKLRKKGYSYKKISEELSVSKSTLSNWFSEEPWSIELKKKLTRKANYVAKKRLRVINQHRKEKWEKWREEHRQNARKEFSELKENSLFISGVNLYWAEGDNKYENGLFRLANTDPRMIALFIKFVREVLEVSPERIKVALILYPDLSEKKCKKFWQSVSSIPVEQFYKVQYIKGKHPTKRSEWGICSIVINSRALKEKMKVWIGLLAKEYKIKVEYQRP